MKYVNIVDAKEQLAELIELLDNYQQDKIILTQWTLKLRKCSKYINLRRF